MKILLVGSYLDPDLVGGAEQSSANLRLVLEAAGHSFATLRWRQADRLTLTACIVPDTADYADADDWAMHAWRPFPPIESGTTLAKAEFYAMEFLTRADVRGVRTVIERSAIDLVMINSVRGLGYDIVDKLCRAGVPVICVLHDFALCCMNKGMSRNGRLCVRRCRACSVVCSLNRTALKRAARLALVAPSRYVVDTVGDALQVEPSKRHHIPNPNTYAVIARVRDHHDPLTLGYIGRLDVEKGVAGILDHADRLHAACGIRLLIAGNGMLTDAVARFASTRPWVDFRGYVPSDEVHHVYDRIDVLTTPSLWPENTPGTLVQAQGCGIPCVGFNLGGVAGVIEHGVTGLLAPFGDFPGLCEQVIALDRDRAAWTAMSRAALVAARRFDPEVLAERWVDLVASLA